MSPSPLENEGPLAGIRVLDLTSVILGAYATQMLGDLGADVIKIESPDGDTTRYTGPCVNDGMASLFMGVNRNKRSIVLDLKQAAARDVLLRMADTADVFVHNIRPQKLEKIGLGSDALLARNPRLIYAGLHGWREGGPYSGRPAYDDIMQGLTGIASLMDTMTGEPRYAPTILADKTCGVDGRAGDRRRAVPSRTHRHAASSSKCRCSRPWSHSSWSSICMAAPSIRRSAPPATAACWRRGGGHTARRTAISAR